MVKRESASGGTFAGPAIPFPRPEKVATPTANTDANASLGRSEFILFVVREG
jgi:hypothetical protein